MSASAARIHNNFKLCNHFLFSEYSPRGAHEYSSFNRRRPQPTFALNRSQIQMCQRTSRGVPQIQTLKLAGSCLDEKNTRAVKAKKTKRFQSLTLTQNNDRM